MTMVATAITNEAFKTARLLLQYGATLPSAISTASGSKRPLFNCKKQPEIDFVKYVMSNHQEQISQLHHQQLYHTICRDGDINLFKLYLQKRDGFVEQLDDTTTTTTIGTIMVQVTLYQLDILHYILQNYIDIDPLIDVINPCLESTIKVTSTRTDDCNDEDDDEDDEDLSSSNHILSPTLTLCYRKVVPTTNNNSTKRGTTITDDGPLAKVIDAFFTMLLDRDVALQKQQY